MFENNEEMECEDAEWINFAQNRDQRRSLVNQKMNPRVSQSKAAAVSCCCKPFNFFFLLEFSYR